MIERGAWFGDKKHKRQKAENKKKQPKTGQGERHKQRRKSRRNVR